MTEKEIDHEISRTRELLRGLKLYKKFRLNRVEWLKSIAASEGMAMGIFWVMGLLTIVGLILLLLLFRLSINTLVYGVIILFVFVLFAAILSLARMGQQEDIDLEKRLKQLQQKKRRLEGKK